MRVWIVASGEPLPAEGAHVRLLRAGNLSAYLRSAGHEVVWWTSSFDHIQKQQLSPTQADALARDHAVRLLPSLGYRKNLGLARLLDHAVLGLQFWRQALHEPKRPDVIWCSYPPIETALAAVMVGRRLGVPVALDVRDLWPDVFLDVLPSWARPLGRLALAPYFMASRHALTSASGLVGVSQSYLDWGLRRAGRAASALDRHFPMGYPDFAIPDKAMREAHVYWHELGIDAARFNVCFFGTLGRQFDIDTVARAAMQLHERGSNARFILCGHGSALDGLREQVARVPNVLFPGHVDASRIKALLELSAVGLAPYHDTENFQLNIPNKIFEYAAGGLPVLSAVDGEVGRFLREHDIGQVYPSGDARALAQAVMAMEQQPSALREQGLRARALFSARFDARTVSAQIEAYLQQLMDATRSSSACPHQIS